MVKIFKSESDFINKFIVQDPISLDILEQIEKFAIDLIYGGIKDNSNVVVIQCDVEAFVKSIVVERTVDKMCEAAKNVQVALNATK